MWPHGLSLSPQPGGLFLHDQLVPSGHRHPVLWDKAKGERSDEGAACSLHVQRLHARQLQRTGLVLRGDATLHQSSLSQVNAQAAEDILWMAQVSVGRHGSLMPKNILDLLKSSINSKNSDFSLDTPTCPLLIQGENFFCWSGGVKTGWSKPCCKCPGKGRILQSRNWNSAAAADSHHKFTHVRSSVILSGSLSRFSGTNYAPCEINIRCSFWSLLSVQCLFPLH